VLEEWERKEAEEALRTSEQRFRQVTENIDEVFWLTDIDKQEMIYISPAYSRVWGRSCESLTADPRSWLEAIHPEDRERVRMAAMTRQIAGTYDVEYRIVRPDGVVRWVHDRAFPISDANGRVYRIAGVAEDITSRLQLEEQLRQSQKMDAIGQLAGGVAHDFNNLLAVIQMQSSLLLAAPSSAADIHEGLQEIMAASERAANLTRQLLTFSRRDVRQARDIDLADVADGMAKLLRRILGEDVALETRVAHALPMVNADPGMMEQVLMNLAVNARDAMPQGGQLLVSLDVVEVDEDDLAAQPPSLRFSASGPRATPGRFVRLRVRDTGAGISPVDLPRIFEPFFTTKEAGKGTGLGLATVFGIVEQHHGWIEVTSELGRGANFEIFLPALPPSRSAARDAVSDHGLPSGTESILLVEDDAAVRAIARACLEHCGYRVHEAESATAALTLWDTLPAPVDLLVTDLIMPGGMSGRELADLLSRRQPGLKVIYNSGYSNDVVHRELRLTPGYNFLQKPYPVAELAVVVRRCLDA
jgi:two-component system, cell cycle sensor histidine kinase and response regulator CckA